jgi:hypothetical protein
LAAAGALCAGGACVPSTEKHEIKLSELGVVLLKDLTADKDGDLQARNVVSAMAEVFPRRLYQVLVAINTAAMKRFACGFAELAQERRRVIITDVYKENGALKQFCQAMVKVHFNYPYRWRIIGYQPVEHRSRGLEDPEFDHYDSIPALMEV